MYTKAEYQARCYTIGTIIKLVAQYNIGAISKVANNCRRHYDMQNDEVVDSIDNEILYTCYCECVKGGVI